MHATQRWPDVIAEAATEPPAQAKIQHDTTAAICGFAAVAAACLGQTQLALRWADKAHTQNPNLLADLAYTRGMVHRQLGQTTEAAEWLGRASINGQLIDSAKAALRDTTLQLQIVDETAVATRSNRWDVSTQKTPGQQSDDELATRRAELLAEGKRELAHKSAYRKSKTPSAASRNNYRCAPCASNVACRSRAKPTTYCW